MSHTKLRIAPVAVLALVVLVATACLPGIGNPGGGAVVPPDGQAVDTSHPTHVVGTGTPASCTAAAVVEDGGQGRDHHLRLRPRSVTITLTKTAKIFNDTGPDIVIDGGDKVTLSGGGHVRILYMDTCDQAQVWTTSHCQDQDTPQLTVQNMTFVDGNSTGQTFDGGGGGAIFVRGGRLQGRATRASSATSATRPAPTSAAGPSAC